MPAPKLNTAQLATYREAEGVTSNADLARRMGVHPATVSRVLAGHIGPSTRFMAGLQRAFPGRNVWQLIDHTAA